jgi:precorrin-2/cobalt-factor-2 C20-methyltransferase
LSNLKTSGGAPKLIGVSLGPGDPGLMTFKAAEALSSSERVFVPGEMASVLARPYCRPEVLEFPMTGDEARLGEIWARNADTVAASASRAKTAFACIGDVNTFSTFTHLKRVLLQRHPEVEVDSIPGVGVVPALASRFKVGLDKSFTVSDGSEVNTLIRIKALRPRKIASELALQDFDEFILGTKLCTPDETITRDKMPEKSDYFSVLYARKRRT